VKSTVRANSPGLEPHPDLEIAYDPELVLASDIRWLAQLLKQDIESGTRFKPDETVQVGWAFFKLGASGMRTLSVLEPDFQGIPMNFVNSVTQTLIHLRLQKSVLESLSSDNTLAFPSQLQSCLICRNLYDRAEFIMERFEISGNDSGWYLGCNDAAHDHNQPENLKRISLYEVACYRPDCIPFLALPSETSVGVGIRGVSFRFAGEEIQVRPDSLVEKYLKTSFKARRGFNG
jgi:hypothetical protein